MIDILNKPELKSTLLKLSADKQPVFGIMTPQHMVEHLILLVKLSNGNLQGQLMRSEETAKNWKQGLIYSDMEFPKGIKVPHLPENILPELRYENLEKAINKLENELKTFEIYFQNNSDEKTMHPALGLLNHEEWVIFHNKHFTHHFRQFELL